VIQIQVKCCINRGIFCKGTDITEAFETHHLSTLPEGMLSNYFVRKATQKRNSPFTFEENGFYKTVKRKLREDIRKIPKDVAEKSKRIIDSLAIGMLAVCILACHLSWGWPKYLTCLFAAILLTWITTCSHNFLHQKDNWRMYLFNFSNGSTRYLKKYRKKKLYSKHILSYREFRIMHILSHHLFPNTLLDAELTLFEPYYQWLPRKSKSFFVRYCPFLYSFVMAPFITDINIIIRLIDRFV
jgi:hypothetical protein